MLGDLFIQLSLLFQLLQCFIFQQVLTRMVLSSSPVVYWFAAEMILQNTTDKPESSEEHIYLLNVILNGHFKNQSRWTKFIIIYFVGYFIIGTFMFSNFLPWT